MSTPGLAFSLAALALLAACATQPEPQQAPAPVANAAAPTVVAQPTAPVRAGVGRLVSITALAPSAAAGGSARPLKRVGIEMEDGTVQYVDSAAEGLAVGSRVELTRDGSLRQPTVAR
jgi:hypothetical protein